MYFQCFGAANPNAPMGLEKCIMLPLAEIAFFPSLRRVRQRTGRPGRHSVGRDRIGGNRFGRWLAGTRILLRCCPGDSVSDFRSLSANFLEMCGSDSHNYVIGSYATIPAVSRLTGGRERNDDVAASTSGRAMTGADARIAILWSSDVSDCLSGSAARDVCLSARTGARRLPNRAHGRATIA